MPPPPRKGFGSVSMRTRVSLNLQHPRTKLARILRACNPGIVGQRRADPDLSLACLPS